MKILGHTVASMYVWAILLLVFLAAASSYLLGEFPYALVFAVLACSAIEMLIRRYYQKQVDYKIPFSGIITGLIIGTVAPINVQLLPILLACAVAILSKFFLKVKSVNLFNPASLGLLVGLGLFSVGSSWWGTTSIAVSGLAVSLSVVLVVCAYESRRLPLAFSFIIASVLLSLISSPPLTLGNLGIALISVNYFFAFLMLTEPKTSPAGNRAQVVYGIGIALLYYLLISYHTSNLLWAQSILFVTLLAGNLAYAIYRIRGRKIL